MDSVILAVRSEAAEAQCPLCATASRRIHSRYIRHVADLPSAGRRVRLRTPIDRKLRSLCLRLMAEFVPRQPRVLD
ncbi:transposase family protein [Bradyrhizobium sp. 18]|uniref:transposase family protein n=1 Tax=Bradyrhizobium sp. 18 TaxID=2782657 RepID=UPI001FFBABA4|nr:transposase family protein [Bradyrhizobium sp. 18]